MSPLKIMMLMRLHCRAKPFDEIPLEQVNAPAMQEAFAYFREHDLLGEQVTWVSLKHDRVSHPFLSHKGQRLVDRLREVQP